MHLVYAILETLESSLSSPDNEFTYLFDVISIGLDVGCEDCFDDLGATGSEIFALVNQFIDLLGDIFCNRNTELLLCHL